MSNVLTLAEFHDYTSKTMLSRIENLLMGDKQKASKFISAMAHCVQTTPKLLQCTKESLFWAFIKCAEFDIYPSSVSWEAYILPYENRRDGTCEAQFQLGYQWFITLLYRSGIDLVETEIVFEKDQFTFEKGLEKKLIHIPAINMSIEARGKAIWAYCIIHINGQKHFDYMNKEQIWQFREFSKSKDSKHSPWNSENDPRLWMWRKTVLKQVAKTLPKNLSFHEALAEDNKDTEFKDEPKKISIPQLDKINQQ